MRINSRDFSLTFPKCPVEPERVLELFKVKLEYKLTYIAVVQEKHKDGDFHLHLQMQMNKVFAFTGARTWDIEDYGSVYHPNVQKTKDSVHWKNYLEKEGKPLFWGEFQEINKVKVRKTKDKDEAKEERRKQNELILNNNLTQLVRTGDISMYNFSQLNSSKNLFLQMEKEISPFVKRECYWVYGKPRCGKSQVVRRAYPSLYNKPQNKWWDGYTNEDVVLLDDFDCSALGHHLKIWADNYSFVAEVKGSGIKPSYTKFFITSNFMPSDLWADCLPMQLAVESRFIFCYPDGDYETGYDLINQLDNSIILTTKLII